MISVVTPTYNTSPDILARTWASLKRQTHSDWEWVIYDDSNNNNVQQQVYGFCSDERYKIRYFRPHAPSGGNIGYAKKMAFNLALGDILVELDHDDELTQDCLLELQIAFNNNPDSGFVYSDCCEILPDGQSGRYPEGWGFGEASDYWDEINQVWAMSVPVNRITLSHIVSMPNHVRAWRASTYDTIGGHNPELCVADDYEIMIRTALETNMFHVNKMLYKQHVSPLSAQRTMNAEIQRLVPLIHSFYSDRLDNIYGASKPSQEEVL
jgi:glycosyltransferase involved in cell wall biosynthesis